MTGPVFAFLVLGFFGAACGVAWADLTDCLEVAQHELLVDELWDEEEAV